MIRYDHSFSHIDKILPKKAGEEKIHQAMVKYQVLKFWEEAASAFVGKIKDETKALDFYRGTLVVACLSETLAKELRQFAARIIYALNLLLGKNLVQAIEVQV